MRPELAEGLATGGIATAGILLVLAAATAAHRIAAHRIAAHRRDPRRVPPAIVRLIEANDAIRRGRALLDEGDPYDRRRAAQHFAGAAGWLASERNQREWEYERRPSKRKRRYLDRLEAAHIAAVDGEREATAVYKA